ncbi:MAG: hypothetical protein JWN91_417 [Nocardioides sp.]|jgi:hypothetical protein|nr:hypothetical protein [Nocardioides sp.]
MFPHIGDKHEVLRYLNKVSQDQILSARPNRKARIGL